MVEIGRIESAVQYANATLSLINLQVFNGLCREGVREGEDGGGAKKCKELYTSLLQAFLSIL